jgi:hypothetical protein
MATDGGFGGDPYDDFANITFSPNSNSNAVARKDSQPSNMDPNNYANATNNPNQQYYATENVQRSQGHIPPLNNYVENYSGGGIPNQTAQVVPSIPIPMNQSPRNYNNPTSSTGMPGTPSENAVMPPPLSFTRIFSPREGRSSSPHSPRDSGTKKYVSRINVSL